MRTRIKFNIEEKNGILELNKKSGQDANHYCFESISYCTANWGKVVSYDNVDCESDGLHVELDKGMYLKLSMKRRTENTNFAKRRIYYLKISKSNNGIILNSYGRIPSSSGSVQFNTWSNSLWNSSSSDIDHESYVRVIDVFLVRSPSTDKVKTTQKFININEKYGSHCFRDKEFRKLIQSKNVVGLYDNSFGFACSVNDMRDKLLHNSLLENIDFASNNVNLTQRFSVVDSLGNQFLSLLRHIRNSLAHGTFKFFLSNDVNYFLFEDRFKQQVTGRGLLKLETLLFWADLLDK